MSEVKTFIDILKEVHIKNMNSGSADTATQPIGARILEPRYLSWHFLHLQPQKHKFGQTYPTDGTTPSAQQPASDPPEKQDSFTTPPAPEIYIDYDELRPQLQIDLKAFLKVCMTITNVRLKKRFTLSDLKKVYRDCLLRVHPDHNPDIETQKSAELIVHFKKIERPLTSLWHDKTQSSEYNCAC